MNEISTYYSDQDDGMTATIYYHSPYNDALEYFIQYKRDGECFYTETFPGRSIYYVEDAAENWSLGIKVLP